MKAYKAKFNCEKYETCQTEDSLSSLSTLNSVSKTDEDKDHGIKESPISFQRFINDTNGGVPLPLFKWKSDERDKDYKQQIQKGRIMSMELKQIGYKDPLQLLLLDYQSYPYSFNLFQSAIQKISFNTNPSSSRKLLIEKREHMEMIRKVIDYYLNYIITKRSDQTIKGFDNLHELHYNITETHHMIQVSSAKMRLIKKHFIDASSKLTLRMKKIANAKKIGNFLKEILQSPMAQLNQLDIDRIGYVEYYKRSEILLTELEQLIIAYPKVNIVGLMRSECLKRIEIVNRRFNDEIKCVFNDKRHNLYDMFYIHTIKNNEGLSRESINSFVDKISLQFKTKTKEIIRSIKNELETTKCDEDHLIQCIKRILCNLRYLLIVYMSYTQLEERNEWGMILMEEIQRRQEKMYGIIDKKVSKLIMMMGHKIRLFSNKSSLLMILNLICLFEEESKRTMGTKYSKYLPIAVKNILIDKIKFQNMKNIIKVGIFLSGDIWERTDLKDNTSLFSLEVIQSQTPLYLRNYLTMFNEEARDNINNDKVLFDKVFNINTPLLIEDFGSFIGHKEDLHILSKPINHSKIIVSSSSVNCLKAIHSLVEDLLFYDSIAFEIFYETFNITDYYIFALFNMFIPNKQAILSLIENLMISEKNNIIESLGIENAYSMIHYKTPYHNLRHFLIATKAKLEVLFNRKKEGIDIEKDCSDFTTSCNLTHFFLPKLNSYDCDYDTTSGNNDHLKHLIISIETCNSLFKVLQRITHFALKIDLEFQSKFIITTINQYKIIINEMKHFIYINYISTNLITMNLIQSAITTFKWEINDIEIDEQLFQTSPFVNIVIGELRNVQGKIGEVKLMTKKIEHDFFSALIEYVIKGIMDGFALVSKCNSTGRSVMLKDLKLLKIAIEEIINNEWRCDIKCNKEFNYLFLYINSWYYSKEDMLSYISSNKIDYKYWNGLSLTSPTINSLSRSQRKDFMQRIEEIYTDILQSELVFLSKS